MNRIVSGALLAMLSAGILYSVLNIMPTEAVGTICIRANGSIDPSTAPISTFDNVTYILNDNITSQGVGVTIERDNIIVNGAAYSVLGNGNSDSIGIDLSLVRNVSVRNMRIEGFDYGFFGFDSRHNEIFSNEILANKYGIRMENGGNSNISKNNISRDSQYGIYLAGCSEDSISENDIMENGQYGIYIVTSSDESIKENNITDNTNGICFYDAYLGDSVSDCNISENSGNGTMVLSSSQTVGIYGNNIIGNGQYGIISHAAGSDIRKNYIASNDQYGIFSRYSASYEQIIENKVENNTQCGIFLDSNCYTNITLNEIRANPKYGIAFYSSTYNTVCSNMIENNGYCGILLNSSSDFNSVNFNKIVNTTDPSFGAGISIFDSSNNEVFNNHFLENHLNAYTLRSYLNHWDVGACLGGNYWSDYTGADLDYDGIGDIPYQLDADNKDNFPLMGMLNVLQYYGKNVYIVSNSSISDPVQLKSKPVGQNIDAVLTFNITGEAGTQGFCRVCIPRYLIDGSYTVKLDAELVTYPQAKELPCSDEEHGYLYINYTYTRQNRIVEISGVTLISESPSLPILSAFMMATLLSVIVYRRRTETST